MSYYKHVRPIFQLHCQGCHQPAKAKGGYVMTNYADLLKTTDHEIPGILPKQPDKSAVMQMIVPKDGKPPEMPREKEPLTQREVSLIRSWIAEGAIDDTPASARAAAIDKEHPPVYELPPVVTGLAFSPDSQLLAVTGYHEVLLHKARWHRAGGQAHRPVGTGAIAGLFAGRQMARGQRRRSGPIRRGADLGRRANESSKCRCRSPSTPSTASAGPTTAS